MRRLVGVALVVILAASCVTPARHREASREPLGLAPAQPKETPLAEGRRMLMVQGQRYGTLDDDDAVTLRVREVFERIVRAAGRRPGLVLEAHVLDTPRIVAQALPGGVVVLSRGFMDLAGADDNALAFVLGHEVAHLIRDHHGLLDSLGVLGAASPSAEPPVSAERARAHQALELEADRLGVLFSALAGYRASAAIPILLAVTARTEPHPLHPSPQERAGTIRGQIDEVVEHLEVFHLGLFLLAVGRYLDAARVLQHFQALFPSREVLSAIGVAYHKEALRYAPQPEFRHLLVIDASTRAPAPKGSAPHPAFRRLMEQAIHYYTQALESDREYAPARNNLGAAYLDLGERELALGHITRALKDDPRLASGYNNRAIALAMVNDPRGAERDWLRAVELAPGLREPVLNLVRLYQIIGNVERAGWWRSRVRLPEKVAGSRTESIGPVVPGTAVNRLQDWLSEPGVRQIKVPLGGRTGGDLSLLLLPRRGVALLSHANVVEAVGTLGGKTATARGLRPGDRLSRIEATYGSPATLEGVQTLNVWGYPAHGLAVFVSGDRVQGIWAGQR